jgi:hypothetical protein
MEQRDDLAFAAFVAIKGGIVFVWAICFAAWLVGIKL